ncbi:MAG: pyridoxal phosphate-dependent aminotransferase [Chloroflexota bacterium]
MTGQHISRRAASVPASPIRALTPLAVETAGRGIKIYHVNIGQPDLPAPREILDAIKAPADGVIPYAPSGGQPETVRAWCTYYRSVSIDLQPANLLVTTGGGEAIGFAMMAVADPGDDILIFDPTYASYLGYAATTNVNLVPIPSVPPDYRLPDPEIIERAVTARTRAMVLINPGNPTGTVYTREEVQAVIDIASRHGLFVISDETYRELVFDDAEHVSVFDFAGCEDLTIVVDSVSKRFSATGLRVGCIASRNRDVMAAALRMAMARLSGPTVGQLAAVPLLENPGPYTSWLRQEYQRRRDAACEALRALPGVSVGQPQGAFYAMASLPVEDASAFARWLLTDFQCNGETVMVAPGPGFYVTPGLGRHEARIAYVLGVQPLRRAMELLGQALAVYPERLAA